ncbi:MAG: hypothetical protein HYZ14_02515 [Bacteroidetes bacterium]|nr:hypothetical protein [Bacteroidota bacterium]
MRIFWFLLVFTGALVANAQHYPQHEISVSFNTIEKALPPGGYDDVTSIGYNGGDVSNHSFGLGICYKKHLNTSMAFRIRGVFMQRHLRVNYALTNPISYYDTETISQQLLKLCPGIQRTFLSREKIKFFGGVEMPLGYIGNLTAYRVYHYKYEWGQYAYRTTNTHVPGGFSAGLGIYLGGSVNLGKRLMLGAEIYSNYSYTYAGGKISRAVESGYEPGIMNPTISQSPTEERVSQFIFHPFQAAVFIGFKL